VNVSSIQFRETTLIDSVLHVLEKTGLPAEKLELDVSENVMQTAGSQDIFNQLRNLDVKIALDDFGTGFSSLTALEQLPIDSLKVDRICIKDLEGSQQQPPLLLGTIIGMGKAMNCTLIAEGIETIEQVLIMSGLGCEILQGYYFSAPIPAEAIPLIINADYRLENKIEHMERPRNKATGNK
jgi:EAL domain-containing protein (putative c-di-GMP-specific phosphodiesterase class I)